MLLSLLLAVSVLLVFIAPVSTQAQTYYPDGNQQPVAPAPAAPYYPAYPYAYPPAYGYGYPPPYYYPQQQQPQQVVPRQPQVPVDPSTVAPYRRDNDETFYPLYYYDN